MGNFRQTQREKEGHQELQIRDRQRSRNRTYSPRTRTRQLGNRSNTRGQNSGKRSRDLKRQGPGYRQERNPHSNLLEQKGTREPPTKNSEGTVDMTKVKCFNCGNFGHYASKCTAPKRRRKQWNELQANEANLISHPP